MMAHVLKPVSGARLTPLFLGGAEGDCPSLQTLSPRDRSLIVPTPVSARLFSARTALSRGQPGVRIFPPALSVYFSSPAPFFPPYPSHAFVNHHRWFSATSASSYGFRMDLTVVRLLRFFVRSQLLSQSDAVRCFLVFRGAAEFWRSSDGGSRSDFLATAVHRRLGRALFLRGSGLSGFARECPFAGEDRPDTWVLRTYAVLPPYLGGTCSFSDLGAFSIVAWRAVALPAAV